MGAQGDLIRFSEVRVSPTRFNCFRLLYRLACGGTVSGVNRRDEVRGTRRGGFFFFFVITIGVIILRVLIIRDFNGLAGSQPRTQKFRKQALNASMLMIVSLVIEFLKFIIGTKVYTSYEVTRSEHLYDEMKELYAELEALFSDFSGSR